MYSVYKHTAPNGKVYIGMTRQVPEKRWLCGWGYQTQKRFYRAIQKYGWDAFSHEVLFEGLPHEEAEQKERELILFYKSYDPNHGYNVEMGGNCAKIVSEQTREKLRQINTTPEALARMQEFNDKRWSNPQAHIEMSKRFSGENNPMFGRKLSEAHKKAFVEAGQKAVRPSMKGENNPRYGTHLSEEEKRKIGDANRGGNNGRAKAVLCVETNRIYASVRDAFRETGVHFSSIAKCCNGINKSAGRLHWRYVDGGEEKS